MQNKYKNKAMLSVTIDKELYEKIEQYNEETMVSKSALVNKLIKEFFNKKNNE